MKTTPVITALVKNPSIPKAGYPNQWYMYPPRVGEMERMTEWVAMLSPRLVPVAVSGTTLVIILVVSVSMRVSPMTSGASTKQSWRRVDVMVCRR